MLCRELRLAYTVLQRSLMRRRRKVLIQRGYVKWTWLAYTFAECSDSQQANK